MIPSRRPEDWKPGSPFPPINNSGFVANYATTADELTGLPPASAWGDVINLVKAEIEFSGGTPAEIAAIRARFEAIRTQGQAHAYAVEVMEKVQAARRERKLAELRRPERPEVPTA